MLAALAFIAGPTQALRADEGSPTAPVTAPAPRDSAAVVAAFAGASAAGDAAGLAAMVSDGAALGDHFCCPVHPTKAQFVDTLPRSWASGLRPRFVVGPATGNTVTLRMLDNYAWDWQAGVAPLEIVYTLVVEDGLVVQGEGRVDPASEQRRAASITARTAGLVLGAFTSGSALGGAPVVVGQPDTQHHGGRSMGARATFCHSPPDRWTPASKRRVSCVS